MTKIKVACKYCSNVFDWNDQWPAGLKRCPGCGILARPDGELGTAGIDQPVQARAAGLKPVGGQVGFVQTGPDDRHLHQPMAQ